MSVCLHSHRLQPQLARSLLKNWATPDALSSPMAPLTTTLYESIGQHEIRIVELLPGSGSDPIICHMENYLLDYIEQCEALSWHWGS